ncbi:MAG: hypothetical protein QHJ34_11615 [bacterium]|nr:hypothetical protein [bacterium]
MSPRCIHAGPNGRRLPAAATFPVSIYLPLAMPSPAAVPFPQPTGSTILSAGTSSDEIFRSADNGASWSEASTGMTDSVYRFLATLDTRNFAAAFGSGVFASPISGTACRQVNNGLANHGVKGLAGSHRREPFCGNLGRRRSSLQRQVRQTHKVPSFLRLLAAAEPGDPLPLHDENHPPLIRFPQDPECLRRFVWEGEGLPLAPLPLDVRLGILRDQEVAGTHQEG